METFEIFLTVFLPMAFSLILIFTVSIITYQLILRGFLPVLPSRPWVVDNILNELAGKDFSIPDRKLKILALSTGRSGLFHALEKKYPDAELIGVEPKFFKFLVAKMQSKIRKTNINVVNQEVHRINVQDVDMIYCHLDLDQMRGLGKKLKFECKPDTIVISTGFNIPFLDPKKITDLAEKKNKYRFLQVNIKMFQRLTKRFRREKKAFYYVI